MGLAWLQPHVESCLSLIAGYLPARRSIRERLYVAGKALSIPAPKFRVDWVLIPCKCRSRWRRGYNAGQDWQLPHLQTRYDGHFIPFLNKLICEKR